MTNLVPNLFLAISNGKRINSELVNLESYYFCFRTQFVKFCFQFGSGCKFLTRIDKEICKGGKEAISQVLYSYSCHLAIHVPNSNAVNKLPPASQFRAILFQNSICKILFSSLKVAVNSQHGLTKKPMNEKNKLSRLLYVQLLMPSN